IDRGRCLQNLNLLSMESRWAERTRLFHRHQGKQLDEEVLNDIASCANTVVIPGATTYADVFSHGDLYVINVVGIPHWYIDQVGKTQSHDILHGFFAEIVIDSEHCIFRKYSVDDLVKFARRFLVVAKGLFDDHTAPRIIRRGSHPDSFDLVADIGEVIWRNREI